MLLVSLLCVLASRSHCTHSERRTFFLTMSTIHTRAPLPLRLVHSSWDLQRFAGRRKRQTGPSSSLLLESSTTSSAELSSTIYTAAGVDDMMKSFLVPAKLLSLVVPQEERRRTRRRVRRHLIFSGIDIPFYPSRQQLGDSFYNRLVDNMRAGASPLVVPSLYQMRESRFLAPSNSTTNSSRLGANNIGLENSAQCFSLLQRGLQLVASNQANAEWALDMARLGQVVTTYQVLVHVPDCVYSATMAREVRRRAATQHLGTKFKNRYVVEHLQRVADRADAEHNSLEGQGGGGGLVAPCGLSVKRAEYGLRGSLYDNTNGLLLSTGTVSQTPSLMPSSSKRGRGRGADTNTTLERQHRLSKLFDGLDAGRWEPGSAIDTPCGLCGARHSEGPNFLSEGAVPFSTSGSIQFTRLALHPTSPLALYEVSTRDMSVTAIMKLFAQHGLFVVGDVAHNARLASLVTTAAQVLSQRSMSTDKQRPGAMKLPKLNKGQAELFLVGATTAPELYDAAAEGGTTVESDTVKRKEILDRRSLSLELLHNALPLQLLQHGGRATASLPSSASQQTTLVSMMQTAFSTGFGLGISRSRILLPMRTGRTVSMRQEFLLNDQLAPQQQSSSNASSLLSPSSDSKTTTAVSSEDCILYDVVGVLPSFVALCPLPSSTPSPNNTAATTATSADVIVVAREEEWAMIYCPICASTGHTMQQCSRAHAAVLDPTPTSALTTTTHNDAAIKPSTSESQVTRAQEEDGKHHTTRTPTLPSVSELKRRLQSMSSPSTTLYGDDLPTAVTLSREESAVALGGSGRAGGGRGGDDLLVEAVPNQLPTQKFSPRINQLRGKQPLLHRKQLVCSYCHGRHHITQCPSLEKHQKTSPGLAATIKNSSINETQKPSSKKGTGRGSLTTSGWCLRCGDRGHSVEHCPKIPTGLHTAIFCAVCNQSFDSVRHTPDSCPSRKMKPNSN
ncbi:Hypothetical protein, putative [Bodo saltans]|uniref:CCHC-type domain-containing protein n=1 Tax=Bodo saltans TaxID=75058 RepID=A0A0S4IRP5_BODSA|nr:Hypothetical protein, putative [Bodo saltans]|eukprot:CUF47791.1 Hypothetical protein, putative [Bodo saltans]